MKKIQIVAMVTQTGPQNRGFEALVIRRKRKWYQSYLHTIREGNTNQHQLTHNLRSNNRKLSVKITEW